MKDPKILLIYKSSALSTAGKLSDQLYSSRRFLENHRTHYASLRAVEAVLKKSGLEYHKHVRGTFRNYKPFDVIITVGGDGTVLQAARWVDRRQVILGVNSDPQWSVGQFCCANAGNFERVFKAFLDSKLRILKVFKLKVSLHDEKRSRRIECLNDVLICHANPAAMSRYELVIGARKEDHRSSGIWFSTAAGSTGAVFSAGGRKMPLTSTDIQYMPRELYRVKTGSYKLTGGVIKRSEQALLASFMPRGRVFVDGAHIKFPFTYGSRAEISLSRNFVQLVHV